MLTLTHLFGFVAFRRNVKPTAPARPAVQAEQTDLLAGWSPAEKARRRQHVAAHRQRAEHLGLANVARHTPDEANW